MPLAFIKLLLADSVEHPEVGSSVLSIHPLVSASISMDESSLRDIRPSEEFVISSSSFPQSTTYASDVEIGSFIECSTLSVTTTTAVSSVVVATTSEGKMIEDSPSFDYGPVAGDSKPVSSSNIRDVVDVDSDHLGSIYIPKWSVTNGSNLNDPMECCEMIDGFDPPRFLLLFVIWTMIGFFLHSILVQLIKRH